MSAHLKSSIKIVRPDPTSFIILDPITDRSELPFYCVHGEVQCATCDRQCWLGAKTHNVVLKGIATPLCVDCARLIIPADSVRFGRVQDVPRGEAH